MADKPAGKDGRDQQKSERRDDDRISQGDRNGPAAAQRGHFEKQHHVIVRDYCAEQFRSSRLQ